ncbi:hypothetical protein EMIHUDRAFT_210856 [Emiliania huxleyi CCMP1516]|uniref:Uncharacterized protein n=2 Tax=Emiliania huxleyi TaxID=2903 RepID=A0A0D3IXE1_EMIH1|nr:hypothetical protein EMIHUDRAFT_210856 [Emiliania huxleyi CCMP1516]EOD15926.1 hypothetical protein EMIHUDRAFT_210856 [Emiliania huxleyi CCMP1516]|eukprot:XP_005768355.1 hypothetical protein EMIHUDRAFT_210856 [Emiliania huxleyi CCMP1516]
MLGAAAADGGCPKRGGAAAFCELAPSPSPLPAGGAGGAAGFSAPNLTPPKRLADAEAAPSQRATTLEAEARR